jgi:hypothetical protein
MFLFKSELQEIMAQMFARMDRMTNNPLSHIDYNHQGIRGKFIVPSFVRSYDGEAYLDWEMTVEQEFNSHLVHEIRKLNLLLVDLRILLKSGGDN